MLNNKKPRLGKAGAKNEEEFMKQVRSNCMNVNADSGWGCNTTQLAAVIEIIEKAVEERDKARVARQYACKSACLSQFGLENNAAPGSPAGMSE